MKVKGAFDKDAEYVDEAIAELMTHQTDKAIQAIGFQNRPTCIHFVLIYKVALMMFKKKKVALMSKKKSCADAYQKKLR